MQRYLSLDMVESRLRRCRVSREQLECHIAQLKRQRELRKQREAEKPPKKPKNGSAGRAR